VVVAMTERGRMSEDLVHDPFRPRVVHGALGGRERTLEEELEDRLPREVELAPKERCVERRIQPGVGRVGDRGRGLRRALEPRAAFRRRLGHAGGQVALSQILDELMARFVIRDEPRQADAPNERGVRGDPAPARVRFVGGIDDADEGSIVGKVDPEVPAPPDVADERLDRGGRSDRASGQRFETGGKRALRCQRSALSRTGRPTRFG
jgi:hypothetical protein